MSESASRRTSIESGTELEGSIQSQCPVTVGGSLRGRLTAPGLTVTRSGSVHGEVSVSELKAQGEISGQIEAETVELAGTVGDETVIRAQTLAVRSSAEGGMEVTFGNCELQIGPRRPAGDVEPRVDDNKAESPRPRAKRPDPEVEPLRT
jgi:cytoskeletal protein CcmA (bactofilin family)